MIEKSEFPWILKYILLPAHSMVWNFENPDTLKHDTFLYLFSSQDGWVSNEC